MARLTSSNPLPASAEEYATTMPPTVARRLRKTLSYLYPFGGKMKPLGVEIERRVIECGATVGSGRLIGLDGSHLRGLPSIALNYAAWLAKRSRA